MRLLAATLSPLYGIYSGFELGENVPVRPGSEEYLDSEKYQLKQRDWNAPGNLNAEVTLLNGVRKRAVALQRYRNLSFHESENPNVLFYRKAGGRQQRLCHSDRLRAPTRHHGDRWGVPLHVRADGRLRAQGHARRALQPCAEAGVM